MRLELVSIPTNSKPLDGAYYEPEGGATAGAVLLFHGNTMNFYVGALRFLPPVLVGMGYACLAFNRRGHDILSTRDSRIAEHHVPRSVHPRRPGGSAALSRRGIPAPRRRALHRGNKVFRAPAVLAARRTSRSDGLLTAKPPADFERNQG
jgi:hypothetical protein